MSEQPVHEPWKRPKIGPWYRKILTGLAVANEQSVPAAQRDESSRPHDAETKLREDSIGHVDVSQLSLPREIYASLDPLLQLSTSITPYERSRFPIIMSYINFWFGATSNPRYSGTFSICMASVIHSKVGRQWLCIQAEQTLRFLRGETHLDQTLMRQKRKGWCDLNDALRSRDTRFEEVMLAIANIGVERLLYGTTAAMNRHATTMDMLLRSRGSIQATMKAAPHMEPYFIMAQFAIGKCYFPDRHRLESVKTQWQFDLMRVLHTRRPSISATTDSRPNENVLDSRRQLQDRVINLAIDVGRTGTNATLSSSSQMMLLLELAWTMIQWAQTPELMRLYFKQMEFLTTDLLIGGGSGEATNAQRNVSVHQAFSRARRDVLTTWCPDALLAFDAEISGLVIDALKMFQYLGLEGRLIILNKLSTWLTADPLEKSQLQLTEAELCALDEQIVQNWKLTMKDPNSW